MNDFIDRTHRDSYRALLAIRKEVIALRASAAAWELQPMPFSEPERIPYLDEIELPRGWFRECR